MRCPVDDAPLREVTRQGVKIDLCSECRGVWLDRGELDHLLEAASAADAEFEQPTTIAPPVAARAPEPLRAQPDDRAARRPRDDDDDDDDDDDHRRSVRSDRRPVDGYAASPRKKSRFGWLSDILEGGE